MKKFTQRIQNLSHKATEIREAIQSVPPKIVEIRDTVTAATGQVQKLRADIISTVSTLRSENDAQLITAMREIDGGAETLAEAGIRLEGVDMDLGPTRRLIVHLERVENVHASKLRALLAANKERPTLHALIQALIKADELADSVEFTYLGFTQLTVEVGLVPSVRIGWRTEVDHAPPPLPARAATTPAVATAPRTAGSAPAASSPSSQESFFERRASAAPPGPTPTAETTTPPAEAAPAAVASPVKQAPRGQWSAGALDRFKKMPDLNKSAQSVQL